MRSCSPQRCEKDDISQIQAYKARPKPSSIEAVGLIAMMQEQKPHGMHDKAITAPTLPFSPLT